MIEEIIITNRKEVEKIVGATDKLMIIDKLNELIRDYNKKVGSEEDET